MARILPILAAESRLTRYPEEIRRFPTSEPQLEYLVAKRWREQRDRELADKFIASHLHLVATMEDWERLSESQSTPCDFRASESIPLSYKR